VAYNSGIGGYFSTSCGSSCPVLVYINGGSFTGNSTVFEEVNPTTTGGQPSQTFWATNYTSGTPYFATNYVTLETSTGTGGSTGNPPAPSTNTPLPN
jgi:hypothetical protein